MKQLPIKIENFKEMIDQQYYYVDKTNLILDVLKEKYVSYIRPSKFGKTLTLSMLYYFFSNKEKDNAYLFNELNITTNHEAIKHLNLYPTILIDFKRMKCKSYEEQISVFSKIIQEIILKYNDAFFNNKVDESDQIQLKQLLTSTSNTLYLSDYLFLITRLLYQHYHQKVIILIDNYDIPLHAAFHNNYYEDMSYFLDSLFTSSFKGNLYLERCVMTGCLDLYYEKSFEPLYSTYINSIFYAGSDLFGFTEKELFQILKEYGLLYCLKEIKEWYGRYTVKRYKVYNPYCIIMYINNKVNNLHNKPLSYWNVAMETYLLNAFIKMNTCTHNIEFEKLMHGYTLIKQVDPKTNLKEMYRNNIYSSLLYAGYLTVVKELEDGKYELKIPNKETYEFIRKNFDCYYEKYMNAHQESLYQSFIGGNVYESNKILGNLIFTNIWYPDNQFISYYNLLKQVFRNYKIKAHKTNDLELTLIVYPHHKLDRVLIIETRNSYSLKNLLQDARIGADQINKKKYKEEVLNEGYLHVVGYGISFYKKQCYIVKCD